MIAVVIVLVIALTIGLAVTLFIGISLQRSLARIPEGERRLTPGKAWLAAIPLLNIVGNFIVLPAFADHLIELTQSDDNDDMKQQAKKLKGLGWGVCGITAGSALLGVVQGVFDFDIPGINAVGIANLVLISLYLTGAKKVTEHLQSATPSAEVFR